MKYIHIKDANEDEFKMFSIQTYSKGILHIKVLHFETRLEVFSELFYEQGHA